MSQEIIEMLSIINQNLNTFVTNQCIIFQKLQEIEQDLTELHKIAKENSLVANSCEKAPVPTDKHS